MVWLRSRCYVAWNMRRYKFGQDHAKCLPCCLLSRVGYVAMNMQCYDFGQDHDKCISGCRLPPVGYMKCLFQNKIPWDIFLFIDITFLDFLRARTSTPFLHPIYAWCMICPNSLHIFYIDLPILLLASLMVLSDFFLKTCSPTLK